MREAEANVEAQELQWQQVQLGMFGCECVCGFVSMCLPMRTVSTPDAAKGVCACVYQCELSVPRMQRKPLVQCFSVCLTRICVYLCVYACSYVCVLPILTLPALLRAVRQRMEERWASLH